MQPPYPTQKKKGGIHMSGSFKKLLSAGGILLLIWLFIRYLLPVALPFLLGAGLALAAEPLTRLLCGRVRLPRSAAAGISVTAVFLGLTLVLLLPAALLVREAGILAGIIPDLGQTARAGLDLLSQWLLGLIRRMPEGIRPVLERNVTGMLSSGSALLDKAVRYVLGLAGALLTRMSDSALTFGTGMIASFMISAKLPQLRSRIQGLISRSRLDSLFSVLRNLRRAIGSWLFAQLKLSAVTWGLLTLGFWLLRVAHAPLWAFVVSLVDALPVLGTAVVLIPWSLVCFIQGQTVRGIGMLGLYAAVALIRSILEPRLVGKQLGLDPLLTLFALYTGYRLWGLGGMILAPLLAVTVRSLIPGDTAPGDA